MKACQLLKSLRLGKRLTQEEVAVQIGVSQAHYSQIEKGEKDDPHIVEAALAISSMRTRNARTGGGQLRAGRSKS